MSSALQQQQRKTHVLCFSLRVSMSQKVSFFCIMAFPWHCFCFWFLFHCRNIRYDGQVCIGTSVQLQCANSTIHVQWCYPFIIIWGISLPVGSVNSWWMFSICVFICWCIITVNYANKECLTQIIVLYHTDRSFSLSVLHYFPKWFLPLHLEHCLPNAGHCFCRCHVPYCLQL